MKIEHILVPVDFSHSTQAAVDYAAEQASKHSARITLYHVFESVYSPASELIPALGRREMAERAEAERKLRKLAASIRANIPVETELETGPSLECVSNRAMAPDVDLVVMSTHARTGWRNLLFRSIASEILRHASCSVVVLREPNERTEQALSAP